MGGKAIKCTAIQLRGTRKGTGFVQESNETKHCCMMLTLQFQYARAHRCQQRTSSTPTESEKTCDDKERGCQRLALRSTLILLAFAMHFASAAQEKTLFARFGITDLDLREKVDVFLLPGATLDVERFGNFFSGASGVDYLGVLADESRWRYEVGLYYNSSTLVGNPQFKVKYTQTQGAIDTTLYLRTDFKYVNAKMGFGYRVSDPDRSFIFTPMAGMDMEYGSITLTSDLIDFVIDESGEFKPRNIVSDGSLLIGLYTRMHMGFSFGKEGRYSFLLTPGIKYTFKLQDDLANDDINASSAGKLSIDFTSGLGINFN